MGKRIAIDLVPIRVGEGGTGSGIWTYARELLAAMDQADLAGLEIVVLLNEGQMPYLNLKNIQTVVFPTGGKNILKRLFWVHVKLPIWCLRNKVDLLHKVATETPWLCPAKRITTIHDFYYEYLWEKRGDKRLRLYERMEHAYFMFVTKLCFNKSRALIAVSEATKQEALQRYPDVASRVHVVHHGAPCGGRKTEDGGRRMGDSELFGSSGVSESGGKGVEELRSSPAAQCLTPDASAFNILCVAKFMEHKGQHLLIEAFETLLEKRPDLIGKVRLTLRGFQNDGDYYRRVVDMVEQCAWKQHIQLVPYDAEESTAEIYADADLVVLLSDYEGFGLPVLEAQAMGVPVLCSALPVLNEVGGDGAVFVDRSETAAIADALERFVDDERFCAAMKQKALANVDRFSWAEAAEQTIAVYRSDWV